MSNHCEICDVREARWTCKDCGADLCYFCDCLHEEPAFTWSGAGQWVAAAAVITVCVWAAVQVSRAREAQACAVQAAYCSDLAEYCRTIAERWQSCESSLAVKCKW